MKDSTQLSALPQSFNNPFRYAPHPLVREATGRMLSMIDSEPDLRDAFAEGKMLGVLIAECPDGSLTTLYGYSGIVSLPKERLADFVPPICDIQDPQGHFKLKEREISELNLAIYKAEKAGRDASAERMHRKELSEYLQKWLFDRYELLNAKGERKTISELSLVKGSLPPGGTGDCALPKLLQYAYLKGLRPRLFGEFWYGAPGSGTVREKGRFYPSCTSKCGYILPYMLEGLDVEGAFSSLSTFSEAAPYEIIYEDESLIVASKPSGMLSVPGKDSDSESLLALLQKRENSLNGSQPRRGPKVYPVHRLDMDTAGLIVFARSPEVQSALRSQFETRKVSKEYIARLDAPENNACRELSADGLVIDLPLANDYDDRPRQKVDNSGKEARTEVEILHRYPDGELLVRFRPHTGRTHQLRVHSAHPEGLGRPISGDRLYGSHHSHPLRLQASALSFDHPVSGRRMEFRLPVPPWGEE